jgi:Tol biopolymer transport system component
VIRTRLLLLGIAATACDGDGVAGPPALVIASSGRAERGGMIALRATRSGASVAPAELSWTVSPAGAATVSVAGDATLLDSGMVTFRATEIASTSSPTSSGTLSIRISVPPSIVFDMHDTISDSVRAGNRNIYRVALDGRDLMRLTSGAGDNVDPAPTPTGSPVVFVTFRGGTPALYSVHANGSAESPIARLPSFASDPDVATDGLTLAFVGITSGTSGLWIANIAGTQAEEVPTAHPGALLASPTWCKGGDSIVVVTTAFANASLFLQSSVTGNGRSLTNGETHDVDPACAPDHQTVAFTSSRDGDVGLFVASGAAGMEAIRRLDASPANDGEPAWLPDGRVVFVADVGTDSAHLAWLDPATGTSATAITIAGGGAPAHPHFAGTAVIHP